MGNGCTWNIVEPSERVRGRRGGLDEKKIKKVMARGDEMSFSRHPRSPSMGLYGRSPSVQGGSGGGTGTRSQAAMPHSYSTDMNTTSWPHPTPSSASNHHNLRSIMMHDRNGSITNHPTTYRSQHQSHLYQPQPLQYSYPLPHRGVRVMREEMEFERLTYGGSGPSNEDDMMANRRDGYIQETDILGDDSGSSEDEDDEGRRRRKEKMEEENERRGGGGGGGGQQPPNRVSRDEDDWTSEEEIDDPEYRELIEREEIVEKYDKGPEAANEDYWENPSFELYQKTDRFGFVHKNGTETEDALTTKRRIEREVRRERKWLDMLKEYEEKYQMGEDDASSCKEWEYKDKERRERERKGGKVTMKSTQPAKLFERIWKGVPEKLRGIVWPRLLRIESFKKVKVYEELLLRARLVSKDIRQIDLDINRTYRDHLAFRKRYDVKQQSLLNVLAAYSMYNTEVGYCQGMSQIVALFLMYLDEEDSFWCLHALMVNPHHTMHGFFVPGFPKLSRFENHFKRVLKKYKPKIYKHLDKEMIPYIYLTKWWFGCFLDRVPFSLTLRLWDLFLVEGDCVLIAMSLNIFKMHDKRIRKLNIEQFMEFIQSTITTEFGFSDDEVMYSLRETMEKLRSDRMLYAPASTPSDLSEVPTKALGPILTRSMADIRSDVAEIQSRCSRANSLAGGRSPHPSRKKKGSICATTTTTQSSTCVVNTKPPPSPSMMMSSNNRSESMNGGRERRMMNDDDGDDRRNRSFREEERAGGSKSQIVHRHASTVSSTNTPPPHDPSSINKHGGGIQPVKRGSYYDNITTVVSNGNGLISNGGGSTTIRRLTDEKTGQMVSIVRDQSDLDRYAEEYGSESGYRTPTRVTHSANHVTYVTIGDDDPVVAPPLPPRTQHTVL